MQKKNAIILVLGLVLFFVIGYWVMSGSSATFDMKVYVLLHTLPASALSFFKFFTIFGNPEFTIVLIGVLTFLSYKTHGPYIVLTGVIDIVLNQSLKYVFKRDRPSVEHLVHASGYSFPSGHTMIAMMLYGFLFYLVHRYVEKKWLKYSLCICCLLLMILIPTSRIYLGVHFASDIIGGVMIGFTGLYACIVFHKQKFQ